MSKKQRQYYSISPSSLAFGYKECALCWQRGVLGSPLQPARTPFPGLFSKIDRAMKAAFYGQPTSIISPDLPPGIVVVSNERILQSQPIGELDGLPIVIRGKLDSTVALDSGETGIIDFKSGNPREDLVSQYARQLRFYQHTLEHPGPTHGHRDVVSLGLHCFNPAAFELGEDGKASFVGTMTLVPIEVDRDQFELDREEVVATLTGDPEPGADCGTCALIKEAGEQAIADFLKGAID